MYLKCFSNNKTKEAILDLCIYCARANSVTTEEEISLIKEFSDELKIDFYEEPKNSMTNDLDYISQRCTLSEQKKIVIELLSIMIADGSCDSEEWSFMKNKVIPSLGVQEEDLTKFYKALQQLYIEYGHLNSLVS